MFTLAAKILRVSTSGRLARRVRHGPRLTWLCSGLSGETGVYERGMIGMLGHERDRRGGPWGRGGVGGEERVGVAGGGAAVALDLDRG